MKAQNESNKIAKISEETASKTLFFEDRQHASSVLLFSSLKLPEF
jgi:hypothetical protein